MNLLGKYWRPRDGRIQRRLGLVLTLCNLFVIRSNYKTWWIEKHNSIILQTLFRPCRPLNIKNFCIAWYNWWSSLVHIEFSDDWWCWLKLTVQSNCKRLIHLLNLFAVYETIVIESWFWDYLIEIIFDSSCHCSYCNYVNIPLWSGIFCGQCQKYSTIDRR